MLSSATALAATIECKQNRYCYGTKRADTLRGTDGSDAIYGRGGGDTLKGRGGDDTLDGGYGSDELYGASEGDVLKGGPGGDTLVGGNGDDLYVFDDGWGNDHITDAALPDNDLRTGNRMLLGDYYLDGPDIQGLDVNLNSDSGSLPEVKNESGTDTINWAGNIIDTVSSTRRGDDTFAGNDAANYITSYYGNDTISGGDGNDEIEVADASGGDTVECRDGDNDTVYRDPPDPARDDPGDMVSPDCEVQKDPPTGTPA